MGKPKRKWTANEEEALRAGVAKHGNGKWMNIRGDPEFNQLLSARSNIALEDKWRNLSDDQGPRDKSKTPETEASPPDSAATPLPSAFVTPSAPKDAMSDPSEPLLEEENATEYDPLIYQALSTLKEPNGSDCDSIASFIEQRYEMPQNFKMELSSRLSRLVRLDKLAEVPKCYKLKKGAVLDTESPTMGQKDPQPSLVQSTEYRGDNVEEAAAFAAQKVAEAENKSLQLAQSVKVAERISTLAEKAESLLQFAKDCFEQSAYGDIVLLD